MAGPRRADRADRRGPIYEFKPALRIAAAEDIPTAMPAAISRDEPIAIVKFDRPENVRLKR